jgi:hypothetical protein
MRSVLGKNECICIVLNLSHNIIIHSLPAKQKISEEKQLIIPIFCVKLKLQSIVSKHVCVNLWKMKYIEIVLKWFAK